MGPQPPLVVQMGMPQYVFEPTWSHQKTQYLQVLPLTQLVMFRFSALADACHLAIRCFNREGGFLIRVHSKDPKQNYAFAPTMRSTIHTTYPAQLGPGHQWLYGLKLLDAEKILPNE